MARMDDQEIARFLERTRQAILMTVNDDGTPNGLPVWFEWDGETVRIFADGGSKKVGRIERDARVSVLVTNDLDEPPSWVRFDGSARIDREQPAFPLAERLASQYWDLDDPAYASVVDLWRSAPEGSLVTIELRPDRVVSSTG